MENVNFINLTPHDVNLYRPQDCDIIQVGNYKTLQPKKDIKPFKVIPATGTVARAVENRKVVRQIMVDGETFNIYRKCYSDPIDLMSPQPNVIYLVSFLTAAAAPERSDLMIVEGTTRDENGKINGCTAFAVI